MSGYEMDVLSKAIRTYGEREQIAMVFEEMAELQKELCKSLRGKKDFNHIAEEIADVEIMLDQMKLLFGCTETVAKERTRKICRLDDRLEWEAGT